ncbi:GlxA family transcriptional regulator [Niveispirillum fermenti]|uniref:GlxA family transcriptional regulator n=1 Tax=Niveispirillum fermenti TaxID=1233113 RepID=UPI003A871842
MADIAVIAPPGSFLASLGACLDAFVVVRAQVEQLFAPSEGLKLEARLHLLTEDGQPVRLADGRRLPCDGAWGGTRPYGLIHIANFRVGSATALDERLAACEPLGHWLRARKAEGTLISASGSALFLLAAAGLVDGMAIPLSRPLTPLCRERFPRLPVDPRRGVVEEGGLILGAGPAAEPALMVRLIERVFSAEAGRWLAAVTGVDRVVEDRLSGDPMVANAQVWLEMHFAQDIRIADLARSLSTSHQTLIRRFTRETGMGPKDYVQHLRIRAAQRLLGRTGRTIDQIAAMVGYRDPRSFRLVFRSHSGMSPTAWRRRATGPGPISHP